jgi:hypothetical protein
MGKNENECNRLLITYNGSEIFCSVIPFSHIEMMDLSQNDQGKIELTVLLLSGKEKKYSGDTIDKYRNIIEGYNHWAMTH